MILILKSFLPMILVILPHKITKIVEHPHNVVYSQGHGNSDMISSFTSILQVIFYLLDC